MSRITYQSSEKKDAKLLSELRTDSKGRVIITDIDDKIIAFLLSDGKALCINVLGGSDLLSPDSVNSGDIVIAYVRDVKKDIGAAFIEYAPGKDGYLPLSKIPATVTVKQGDLIPVRLTSEAQKKKRASFSAGIDYSKYPDGELLRERSGHLTAYSYVYKDRSFLSERLDKVFRKKEYSEIITDVRTVYENLVTSYDCIRFYDDESFGLSKLYSLKTVLEESVSVKVWLKCGGYLYIEHTEAMTVIDVNSGKYTPSRGTDKESAYLNVNTEAAIEVCRQLRLRNISGIVIVDFINLVSEDDRNLLMETLRTEALRDTVKVSVVDITALGLVEITRKKELPPLYEQLR